MAQRNAGNQELTEEANHRRTKSPPHNFFLDHAEASVVVRVSWSVDYECPPTSVDILSNLLPWLHDWLHSVETWRQRLDQIRELKQLAADTHWRLSQLQKLAERADAKLKSLSSRDSRAVIEALDLKVQVLGWHSCEHCGGAGKLKGGCGGTPCPFCHMVRYVPELHLDGVWTSDFDLEDEAPLVGESMSDTQHTLRL